MNSNNINNIDNSILYEYTTGAAAPSIPTWVPMVPSTKPTGIGISDPRLEKERTERVMAFFKDAKGRYRTQSLFLEQTRAGKADLSKYPPVFCLTDEDRHGCISMKSKYLEIADPTEYEVGIRLLGSYKHWQVLCEREWFKPHLEEWRNELKIKLKSEAFKAMREQVNSKGMGTTAASKWMYDIIEGKQDRRNNNRGRPPKKTMELFEEELNNDAERISVSLTEPNP